MFLSDLRNINSARAHGKAVVTHTCARVDNELFDSAKLSFSKIEEYDTQYPT